MAEMYKNIKTGVKAEFVEFSKDGNMVTLKKEGGGFTAPTKSSFEKYWKKIEGENATPTKTKKVEDKKPEAKKSVEEKKQEKKAEQPKPAKVEKEKKPKKERKAVGKSEAERLEIRDILMDSFKKIGVNASISEKYPLWINIKVGDKNAFGIGLGATHIRLRTIKELLPKTQQFKEVKGGMSATIIYAFDQRQNMLDLVKFVNESFKDSDILKRKERAKKPKKVETKKKVEKTEKEKK